MVNIQYRTSDIRIIKPSVMYFKLPLLGVLKLENERRENIYRTYQK